MDYNTNTIRLEKVNNSTTINGTEGKRSLTTDITNETKVGYNVTFNYIKEDIEKIATTRVKFQNGTGGETIKSNRHFDVVIKRIDPSFNFTEYFQSRRDSFQGFFDAHDCLINNLYNTYLLEKPLNVWMVFIEYKTNPYIYEPTITNQTISNFQTVFFLDVYANKIEITNCKDKGDYPIKFYYPIIIPNNTVLDYINSNRHKFIYPEKLLAWNNPVFTQPKFIFNDGSISAQTLASRIEINHKYYNFTCRTFNSTDTSFNTEGLLYDRMTSDFFLVCKTYDLTFSKIDYLPKYEYNPPMYITDSRFYFVNQFQVFFKLENYMNIGVYSIGGLFVIFLILLIVVSTIEKKESESEVFLEDIKYYIIRMAKPYYTKEEVIADVKQLEDKPEILIQRDNVNIQITEEKSYIIEHVEQDTLKTLSSQNSQNKSEDNSAINQSSIKLSDSDKPAEPNVVGGKEDEKGVEVEVLDKEVKEEDKNKKKKQSQSQKELDEIEEINIVEIEAKKEAIEKKKGYLKGKKQMIKFLEDNEEEVNEEEELAEKDKPKKKKKKGLKEGPNEAQMANFFKKQENQSELPKLFSPQKKVVENNFVEGINKFDLDEKIEKEKDEKINKEEGEKQDKENGDKPDDKHDELKNTEEEKQDSLTHFGNNLVNRNIYISPFVDRDVFHPRWRKLVVTFNSVCLMFFLNALIYTQYDKIIIENIQNYYDYFLIIAFSSVVAIVADLLVIIFVVYFFRVPQYIRERLYRVLLSGVQMKILKEW